MKRLLVIVNRNPPGDTEPIIDSEIIFVNEDLTYVQLEGLLNSYYSINQWLFFKQEPQ